MNYKKIRRIAIIISILLHFFFLFFLQEAEKIQLFAGNESESQEEIEDDRLVFEFIETPENIVPQEPETESDLVSDKNTVVRDNNPQEFSETDDPYSEGERDYKAFEQPDLQALTPLPEETAEGDDADQEETEDEPEYAEIDDPAYKKVVKENSDLAAREQPATEPDRNDLENLFSSTENKGGISFNTYEWNFAPYLLAMKKRIENHWKAPYAYTHLGAIRGYNIFRFTVRPDGHVTGLIKLDSNAHYSLDQSSSMAIDNSSPFMPLPNDFPEENLVVTVKFYY